LDSNGTCLFVLLFLVAWALFLVGEAGLGAEDGLLCRLLGFVLAQFIDQCTEGQPTCLLECRVGLDFLGLAQLLNSFHNGVGWGRQVLKGIQCQGAFGRWNFLQEIVPI
jgi:hypothetical protein